MSLHTPPKLQGLRAALYHKAKWEPNYRLYALYDKVWRMEMLAHAYALNRQNDGAPGVDGQTFADIEAYGVEQWLGELQEELRTERYRPLPVRRVLTPKPGGVGERPLGIPPIRDRVAQMAVKLVLEPIFEAEFDDTAYGYRPQRRARLGTGPRRDAAHCGQRDRGRTLAESPRSNRVPLRGWLTSAPCIWQ
jgi:RNA-directed DNA polymerase